MTPDISIVNFFLHRYPCSQPFACIPMGPMYLCSALEEAGYAVEFHDYQLQEAANPYDPRSVSEFLQMTQADLIGISCMSNMLPFLAFGLRLYKQVRPNSFIVLGGSGPSGLAIDILAAFSEVDAVVSGEGEEAIVEIVEAYQGRRRWRSILGLTYREDGQIRTNQARPRRRNIDQIPWPAYKLLDRKHYLNFPVLTARGCPYHCTFCDIAPNWDRRVIYRNIDAVLAEIEMLQSHYGTNAFSILDDTFILSRKRVVEFCTKVIDRRMGFEWSCMCRVDLLSEELMDLMGEAGCQKIFLGIESGSDRVRKIAGKGLRIKNVEEMIAKAAARFDVASSFIIGFPFESLEEFRETLFLAMYSLVKGAQPQFCILSPLPQAELTCSNDYQKVFEPQLVSGMVFSRYQQKAAYLLSQVLTPEVRHLIRSEPKIFSAFYHFKEGQVREKLEMAMRYGLSI